MGKNQKRDASFFLLNKKTYDKSRSVSKVKCFIPVIQRAASSVQAKILCVRAGRYGAAPPVLRLLDGLMFISFLALISQFCGGSCLLPLIFDGLPARAVLFA
jgi:hypothetical protein